MKKIVYTVTDHGVDGREPTKILYASFSEEDRGKMLEEDKGKNWRSLEEQIVDLTPAMNAALAKLNGIDRLVLGIAPWPFRYTDKK